MEELIVALACCVASIVNILLIVMFLVIDKVKSLNRKSEEITLMSRRMYRWEKWKEQKLEEYDRIENETSHQKDRML